MEVTLKVSNHKEAEEAMVALANLYGITMQDLQRKLVSQDTLPYYQHIANQKAETPNSATPHHKRYQRCYHVEDEVVAKVVWG